MRPTMNKPWIAFHLEEAIEELQRTLNELPEEDYSEEAFRTAVQHAYNHLNTAWNSRTESEERTASCTKEDFYRWRDFPTDIYMGR